MTTEEEIPKFCKAGVVVNEGPNFDVKVEMVLDPEPGESDEVRDRSAVSEFRIQGQTNCFSD